MNKAFIPVMLTPFNTNGEVDFNGLTQLTEYYLQSGAKGLFANCLSSEMYELSEAERLQVVQHVVKVANGAVPVVATGTFEGTIQQQADFVKQIYDTGTQAVIIITGLMVKEAESDDLFNRNIFHLMELTPNVPLGFYECPLPYKRLISASQLKLFVETGRFTYHKDTCLSLEQVKAKIAAGANYNFGLYDAYMVNAVASLQAGAAGLSCIQGNYFPKLIAWLCDHFDQDELATEVAKVQDFFLQNMDIMHEVYPYSAKYCLQKAGLAITTTVRTQGGDFSPAIQTKVDKLYDQYQQLENELQLEIAV